MPFFDLPTPDLRRLGRRAKRSTLDPGDRRLVTQQPDDRPIQPLQSCTLLGGITGLAPVTAHKDPTAALTFTESIVSRHDYDRPIGSVMARSTEIRPPVVRDYDTPGKGDKFAPRAKLANLDGKGGSETLRFKQHHLGF